MKYLLLSTVWALARFSIADDTGGGGADASGDATAGVEDVLAEGNASEGNKAADGVAENATEKKDGEGEPVKKDGEGEGEKKPEAKQVIGTDGKPLVDKDGKPVLFEHIEMKVPEGMELDGPLVTSFKALAEAAVMSKETQTALFDMFLKSVQENDDAVAKSWIDHQKTLQDAAKADPTIGGDKWTETTALARTGIKAITALDAEKYPTYAADLGAVLRQTGAINHAVVMRFLRDVGVQSGESTKKTVPANAAAGGKGDAASRLYPTDPFKKTE
jgi:hypothetical protein